MEFDLSICSNCSRETKTKKCQGCMMYRYCSVECQRAQWPHHKTLCKIARARGVGAPPRDVKKIDYDLINKYIPNPVPRHVYVLRESGLEMCFNSSNRKDIAKIYKHMESISNFPSENVKGMLQNMDSSTIAVLIYRDHDVNIHMLKMY